jgi:hypothetical protein
MKTPIRYEVLDQVAVTISQGKMSAEEKVFCIGYLIGAACGSTSAAAHQFASKEKRLRKDHKNLP